MKIIIATPLYPPEIAEPAPYVKELAKRLKEKNEITIVAYARLPEKVDGVHIIAVNKRQPLLIRLFLYTIALMRVSLKADIIYAQNGASVEFPAALTTLITGRPLIIHLIDEIAHQLATKNKLFGYIERFAIKRSRNIITDMPLKRPEILPFEPKPEAKYNVYNKSWDEHIRMLQDVFKQCLG